MRDAVAIYTDCSKRAAHSVMEICEIYFPGLAQLLR